MIIYYVIHFYLYTNKRKVKKEVFKLLHTLEKFATALLHFATIQYECYNA